MKKQIFLFLLALLPMVAWADASGTCGANLIWTYVEATKTLTISGTGEMNNYKLHNFLPPWNTVGTLQNVIIEEGVTSIGNYAFRDCSSLTSVTIPESVTSIGNDAFYGCSSLTTVHITDLSAWCGITFSGGWSNPLLCAEHLFLNGEEIKNLVIPESVTSIGNKAFYSCSGLTSVTISNSVTSIGDYAFSGCSGLTSVTIPESMTSIGDYAFNNCSSLTTLIIGSNVNDIGSNVFNNVTTLMTVISLIKRPFNVSGTLFSDETYRLGTLYVPKGTKDMYNRFECWQKFLVIEEMEEGDTPAPNGDCATPTIIVAGNQVSFQCETPGAEFESVLTTEEQFTGAEMSLDIDEITYTLTVYATAPDYNRSKPAKYVFKRKKGDVNGDGAVSPADAIEALYIYFGVNPSNAPRHIQPALEPQ